jgi:hypothetical protein
MEQRGKSYGTEKKSNPAPVSEPIDFDSLQKDGGTD